MAKYCNRKGVGIRESEWRELQEDYEYTHLAEYESEKLLVQCVWHGRVDERAHEMFWEPYAVLTWNKVGGKWVEDPDTKKFGDETDALTYYNEYLVGHTECLYDPDGNLMEVGNLAAERRAKAIAEKRLAEEEKARKKRELAEKKEAERKAIEAEQKRKAEEEAERQRIEAERIERERIEARGPSYGAW